MKADIIVDARFKSCPGPLLALVEAVSRARSGQIVELLANDPAAPLDVKTWASNVGHNILKVEKIDDVYRIFVEVS